MFARVITARASGKSFDDVVAAVEQELPGARGRHGFAGYFLLTDQGTGDVLIMSLWESEADLRHVAAGADDGVHHRAVPMSGLGSLQLRTYEVAVRA